MIPPAYGLRSVPHATFTGDGDVRYWNNYVAVTQMGGQGSFVDERIGIERRAAQRHAGPGRAPSSTPCATTSSAWTLRHRPPDSFDAAAAQRGRAVFDGAGRCASCHQGDGGHRSSCTRRETGHGPGVRDAYRHQALSHDTLARRCSSTRRTSTTAARSPSRTSWITTSGRWASRSLPDRRRTWSST